MISDFERPTRTTTCPTCKSSGFQESILGSDRCSFCDGSEGGAGPSFEDVVSLLLDERSRIKALEEAVSRFQELREALVESMGTEGGIPMTDRLADALASCGVGP